MENYKLYKINSQINVRSEPSLKSSPSAIPYQAGEIVMVFEEKGGWGKVGENQWINLSYATEQE